MVRDQRSNLGILLEVSIERASLDELHNDHDHTLLDHLGVGRSKLTNEKDGNHSDEPHNVPVFEGSHHFRFLKPFISLSSPSHTNLLKLYNGTVLVLSILTLDLNELFLYPPKIFSDLTTLMATLNRFVW